MCVLYLFIGRCVEILLLCEIFWDEERVDESYFVLVFLLFRWGSEV